MSNKITTVRLNPKLIESLKSEAKDDDRSLNNLINKILSNHVKLSYSYPKVTQEDIDALDERIKKAF